MKHPVTFLAVSILASALFGIRLPGSESTNFTTATSFAISDVRVLFETSCVSGTWPSGVEVRVFAHLWGPPPTQSVANPANKTRDVPERISWDESWEFTSNQVYRVVRKTGLTEEHHRVESRRLDSGKICNDLLQAGAFTIAQRKGTGPETLFAGTGYKFGVRSIEILKHGAPILDLTENCVKASYRESDAVAFALLYERLANQARSLFKPVIPVRKDSE